MKKVLALVLAVLMMATVAFADVSYNVGNKAPGGKVVLDSDGTAKDALTVNSHNKLNSDNYSVTGLRYTEGKAYVKGVEFNDDNNTLEVKLKNNYELTAEKDFEVTFTLKSRNLKKGEVKESIKVTVAGTVVNTLDQTSATADSNDEIDLTTVYDGTIYKMKTGSQKYATLSFPAASTSNVDADVEVRVYDGEKYFLFSEPDADKAILKAYPDADLTFLTFTGNPTFNATATVRLYADEDTYFYVNNDGKLVDITGKRAAGSAMDLTSKVNWDEDEGCFILKTRTLGSYVFSDTKLNVAATADNVGATTNPDTGANDVVGIATALAAVALVSAAAVSLKK